MLELSHRLEGKGPWVRRSLWPPGPRQVYEVDGRIGRHDDLVLLNHAIHMAAITQLRYKHSDGRAYYDRKIAEGKPTRRRCGA